MPTQFNVRTNNLAWWHMLVVLTSEAEAGGSLTPRGQPGGSMRLSQTKQRRQKEKKTSEFSLMFELLSFVASIHKFSFGCAPYLAS